MMRSKGQSQSLFMRIMVSPIRALARARDAYVRGITTCGHSMSYGNPMDAAGKFSALSRSQSVATTRSDDGGDDYAELLRAASARTMVGRIDMDLILKQQQQEQQQQQQRHHQYHHGVGPKGSKLPKSSSVGMGRIDEETPYDTSEGGVASFVPPADSYPRSKSYAVGKRNVAF